MIGQPRYPRPVEGCTVKFKRQDNIRLHLRRAHPDSPLTPAGRRRRVVDSSGATPTAPCTSQTLMHAASTGDIGLLEILLRQGIDLATRADDGSTALHCAVQMDELSMISFLLRNGACPEVLNDKEQSPLHQAVLNRNRAAARLLLHNGATLSEKVLYDVIKLGLVPVLQDALDVGGHALFDRLGLYAFRKASRMDQVAIIYMLKRKSWIDYQWILLKGISAVVGVMRRGCLGTFETFLTSGVLSASTRVGQQSLLHIAAVYAKPTILDMLLRCEDCEVNATNGDGWTPLIQAIRWWKTENVEALLRHPQIMVNDRHRHGATALHLAIERGQINIVELLLEHPAIAFNL